MAVPCEDRMVLDVVRLTVGLRMGICGRLSSGDPVDLSGLGVRATANAGHLTAGLKIGKGLLRHRQDSARMGVRRWTRCSWCSC